MSESWHEIEDLLDLLIRQSTEGLHPAEEEKLAVLLRKYPRVRADDFDAAVAAVLLAASPEDQAMPTHLAERIVSDVSILPTPQTTATVVQLPVQAARRRYERAGWWAAAACAVLAVAGWWPRLLTDGGQSATPEQARAALLGSGRTIQASWSPAGAGSDALVGDVVFDPVTQRGYLRFRGIPANDPRVEQYQLWIADAERQPPEPVDGGVFDVRTPHATRNGDVIVPFEAKLPVGKPAAFVVTVEDPGGVVVSRQERVLAMAVVDTA